LYCFEWFVTVVQEVEHIWVKNWTLSTWIFAVNRYATMGALSLVLFVAAARKSLRPLLQLEALHELVVAEVFSGLRVFALCNRNVWLFLVVFALNMVPFATNMVMSLSTRGCVILADVIVLVVTWIKTFGTVREASRLKIKVPLSEIMIRDGELVVSCSQRRWTVHLC
ncbi:hypothetical protein BC835DRAFT_1294107, partial [Cytidiella melzeri]